MSVTTLTDEAVYGSPYPVTVSFTDKNGVSIVPNELSWSLTNAAGTTINNRSSVSITPASSVTITLQSADIIYADGSTRILTITGTYDSSFGSNIPINKVLYISVAEPTSLIINQSNYHRILSCIGYPIVSVSDLGLTDDQIKDLFVLPVLRENYFVFFPKKNRQQYSISSSIDIDFPSTETIGVIDARLNAYPNEGATKTANPLINQLNITGRGRSQKKWGTKYDYGFTSVKIMERMETESTIQSDKAFKVYVDRENSKLVGYTNVYGELSVTWAYYSNVWEDIEQRFNEDAIKLAQARILEYFGMLREQSVGDLPEELGGTEFLSKAEDYRNSVMEKWQKYSKVVILR